MSRWWNGAGDTLVYTTLTPTCNPRIFQWAALSSGPGHEYTDADENLFEDQNSQCVFVWSVNHGGGLGDEEKPEGGFGPPSWSKCAVTFSDAGHYCGSISWYSDLLTRWWIQLFHFQDHGRLMWWNGIGRPSASFAILLKKLFLKIIFLFVTFFSWVYFGMKWLPAIIFLYVFYLFISVVSYVYEEG